MLTRGAGRLWLLYAACLAVVFATMGWLTVVALRLEASERETRLHSAREESVRLALWRMDAALGPLVAREAARLPAAYSAFHPPDRVYTRFFGNIDPGDVLVPSELLTLDDPRIRLHFEYGPDGALSSPQAPEGNMRDLAEAHYTSPERIAESHLRLTQLASAVSLDAILDAMAQPAVLLERATTELSSSDLAMQIGNEFGLRQQQNLVEVQVPSGKAQASKARDAGSPSSSPDWSARTGPGEPAALREDAMRPVFVSGELLLVRRAEEAAGLYVQGCWVDWPTLRQELLGIVADLFPRAKLAPDAARAAETDLSRRLATIPARLEPGPLASAPRISASPIRIALGIAWAGALAGMAALGGLVAGLLAFSARRAAFVTAVTHELRTPLTTFRMYTEMLVGGMVVGAEKQQRYLHRLQLESERLSHLVENVLAYARLERSPARLVHEPMSAEALLDRVARPLRDRADRQRMSLVIETSASAPRTWVRADPSVVEQILLNLVDNACKYANGSADRRVHLEVSTTDRRLRLRVRDHGPGIAPAYRRRLFRAFSKSARDAAESAPGVGLGLALSRRLARSLGGQLHAVPQAEGACLQLTIPTCPVP